MRVQAWLEQRWYGGREPGWGLRGLTLLFAGLVALRRWLYRRGWLSSRRLPVPVLVIGNLTVGGAGKTPLAIALCEALRARGWRPAVVSRGYGRRSREVLRVMPDSSAEQVGDEPRLIAARSGCPVAVASRRTDAAELLLADRNLEIDVIVADDGLQHLALQRDLEIVVVDCARGLGNQHLLPAGPLREPASRLAEIALRVGNGGSSAAGVGLSLTPMHLRMLDAVPLQGGPARALSSWRGQRVHAVAGIGHPQRFFAALRALGLLPVEHPFPDHHAFVAADLDFAEPLPVLMTEKDAVKCRSFARPDWYTVPVSAELPADWFDALHTQLEPLRRSFHVR